MAKFDDYLSPQLQPSMVFVFYGWLYDGAINYVSFLERRVNKFESYGSGHKSIGTQESVGARRHSGKINRTISYCLRGEDSLGASERASE